MGLPDPLIGMPKAWTTTWPVTDNCPDWLSGNSGRILGSLHSTVNPWPRLLPRFVHEIMGSSGLGRCASGRAEKRDGDAPHITRVFRKLPLYRERFLSPRKALREPLWLTCVSACPQGARTPTGKYLADASYRHAFGQTQPWEAVHPVWHTW